MKRNLLLSACAFLVALAATELVLRATHAFDARLSWTVPDPEMGWRFEPGRQYWFFKENDHAITGRIDGLGWRDRERAKRADTRVAVIGDSYVEAFQVELDSTFVAIAERIANARGVREKRSYEFMNFGRSGMGPAEESVVLRRDVLPCAPDVVVLLFTPSNDIADVDRATAPDLLRPFYVASAHDSLILDTSFQDSKAYRVRKLLNPLKRRSALVSLVAERYNASRVAHSRKHAAPNEASMGMLTPEQTLMTGHPNPVYLANYALAKRVVVDMSRACASRGATFVLMSVPLVYEDAEIAQLRARDPSIAPDYFDRDLAAMADTSGFDFVSLTEAFSARGRATEEPLRWSHWNYRGHRLVGELLAEAVSGLEAAPLHRQ